MLGHRAGADLEGVERVAVARGVHPRVEDAEAALVEIAANACEQVALVRRVDQHLQAFTDRRAPRAYHRLVRSHQARQLAGMPGDVGGVVAHEVAHVERVPQALVRFKGQRIQRDHHQRLALARLDLGFRIGCATAQGAQTQAVQVLEQLAFPGVPYLGRCSADIGHRQQIQPGEVALAAYPGDKSLNHVGVAEVRLLRRVAHRQVFTHQKLDHRRIVASDRVLPAKAPHVTAAKSGMVAPAALGDIVK